MVPACPRGQTTLSAARKLRTSEFPHNADPSTAGAAGRAARPAPTSDKPGLRCLPMPARGE
eukprot:12751845-Alexandrium_andersonii.AAC.1